MSATNTLLFLADAGELFGVLLAGEPEGGLYNGFLAGARLDGGERIGRGAGGVAGAVVVLVRFMGGRF